MKKGEQRRLAVLSSASEVRSLATFCTDAISGILIEKDVASTELAIVEAANNILKHAYNSEEGHPIQLSISHKGTVLEFLFFDKGAAFEYSKIASPDFSWRNVNDIPEGGWGVYLINSMMDEVEFNRQGNINILKMIKKIPSAKSEKDISILEVKQLLLEKETDKSKLLKLCKSLNESEETINEMAEELSSAYESLNLFYSLSRDVALLSDLKTFLENTVEKILSASEADWGVVRLRNEDKLEIAITTDKCPKQVLNNEIAINNEDMIEGKVSVSLKEEIQSSYLGLPVQVLCLPIVGLDEFLGTILLGKYNISDGFTSGNAMLTRAMADQIAVSIENNRLYSKAMDAELTEQEIQIATNLQKKLIIQEMPEMPKLRFFTKTEPARQVGGDYLTLEKVSDSAIFLILCDAMGKGMSASYFSLLSHMAIHSILLQQKDRDLTPGQLLSLVNKIMFRDFDLFGMFMTGFIGKIDLEKNLLSYASAGHCQPLLFSPEHGVELLDTADFMMGVDTDIEYTDFHASFLPDMKLLIYSDGLTDIAGTNGEIIGIEPLMALCNEEFNNKDIVTACEKIYEHIVKISGENLQDDISMIGVERFV